MHKPLPSVLISSYLSFLSAADIAKATTVCRHWQLNAQQDIILFKTRYETDFEMWTASSSAVTVLNCEHTSWQLRYGRRVRIERNWRHGRATMQLVEGASARELCLIKQPSCLVLRRPNNSSIVDICRSDAYATRQCWASVQLQSRDEARSFICGGFLLKHNGTAIVTQDKDKDDMDDESEKKQRKKKNRDNIKQTISNREMTPNREMTRRTKKKRQNKMDI
jgi:hypothetical protein